MNAADIATALGAKRTRGIFTAQCPACGYKAALTLTEKDGRTLLHCHVGCAGDAVIDELRDRGLWGGSRTSDWHPRPAKAADPDEAEARRQAALKLWQASVPSTGTVVDAYFKGRGITIAIPPTIRYLAGALHSPTGLRLPAMVAAVTHWPSREVCAIHRTFLMMDGRAKAQVSNPKMTLGPIGGGAVRLSPAGPVLGVAEGIETALSAMQATGVPVWAAISAGVVEALRLPDPPLATEVVIFADHDPVGRRAAETAAERWHAQARKVRICLPPRPDTDFNDLLRAENALEISNVR
jgi:phage/plasmid primase-like uncharacterized protein